MTYTLELSKTGLAPMTPLEMQQTEGGSFWSWLAGIGAALVITGIIISSGGLAFVGFTALLAGATGMIDQSPQS